MSRRSLSGALLVVAAVISLTAGCTAGVESQPSTSWPDLTLCRDYDKPLTVSAVSEIVNGTPDVEGWLGGDVGASAMLQDGRYVFAFGDTVRRTETGAVDVLRNSFLTFGNGHACLVKASDEGSVIPDRSDGVGYWPMSLVAVPQNDKEVVTVFAQRVRSGAAPQDFSNLGSSIATFSVMPGQEVQFDGVTDMGPDATSRKSVTWGAASWLDEDGWLYIFGTSNPEQDLIFGWAVRVARARPDTVSDVATWTYWDGSEWIGDASRAVEVIGADGGPSQTLSLFRQGQTWFVLSKKDEYLGTDLIVWSGPSPVGPFTPSESLASIPSDLGHGIYRYMPLAHPELLTQDGTMVVSVSRNSGEWWRIFQNPIAYRPEFLRIALPS